MTYELKENFRRTIGSKVLGFIVFSDCEEPEDEYEDDFIYDSGSTWLELSRPPTCVTISIVKMVDNGEHYMDFSFEKDGVQQSNILSGNLSAYNNHVEALMECMKDFGYDLRGDVTDSNGTRHLKYEWD